MILAVAGLWFAYLQAQGIIYNRRGIGYFVAERAYHQARELKRRSFVDRDLPQLFKTMDLLGLEPSDLERYYRDLPQLFNHDCSASTERSERYYHDRRRSPARNEGGVTP